MFVGGTKSSLDPLSFDGGLELRDAAVEGFLLGGVEVGASAAAAAAVVPSSSLGKGRFKLCEDFFYFMSLVGGGLGELAKNPLDDLIAVRGGVGQVVEVGVKVLG